MPLSEINVIFEEVDLMMQSTVKIVKPEKNRMLRVFSHVSSLSRSSFGSVETSFEDQNEQSSISGFGLGCGLIVSVLNLIALLVLIISKLLFV